MLDDAAPGHAWSISVSDSSRGRPAHSAGALFGGSAEPQLGTALRCLCAPQRCPAWSLCISLTAAGQFTSSNTLLHCRLITYHHTGTLELLEAPPPAQSIFS